MALDQRQREAALDRLPLPYSVALRLRDAGIDDPVIARCVGVEPDALPALMTIGAAKLAAVEKRDAT